jgi:hypothetical protein
MRLDKEDMRKSKRNHSQVDYHAIDDVHRLPSNRIELLHAFPFASDTFPRLSGHELTLDYLRSTGFNEPIVIPNKEGLDLRMPGPQTTIHDLVEAIGRDHPVEVMDVETQGSLEGWMMQDWGEYFDNTTRSKVLNVISLEVSNTPLAKTIERPRIVRELDWVETIWPKDKKQQGIYPHVQLYCLMSVANCYTDFHIDFAGTSVFYHLISGSKVFYFIQPTAKNLKLYERWLQDMNQSKIFFGEQVKECIKVELTAGNTMLIPTGWIHAVYTPQDSLVIGGNFLHSLNITGQLQANGIEERTRVDKRYRYPHYDEMLWYAVTHYRDVLQDAAFGLTDAESKGLRDLVVFLNDQLKLHGPASIPEGFESRIGHLAELMFALLQRAQVRAQQRPPVVTPETVLESRPSPPPPISTFKYIVTLPLDLLHQVLHDDVQDVNFHPSMAIGEEEVEILHYDEPEFVIDDMSYDAAKRKKRKEIEKTSGTFKRYKKMSKFERLMHSSVRR